MRLSIASCACLLAATVAYAQTAPRAAAPAAGGAAAPAAGGAAAPAGATGGAATGATGTARPPATGTATGAAATHTVQVGGPAGNKFVPATTNVKTGDLVMFMFPGSTHNVIQSDAPNGCTKSANPLAKQFPAAGGLATAGSVWNYTVTPLTPTAKGVWMYCAPHCAGGMTTSLVLSGAAGGAAGDAGGAAGDAAGTDATAPASAASSGALGVAGKALALGSVAAGAVFLRL